MTTISIKRSLATPSSCLLSTRRLFFPINCESFKTSAIPTLLVLFGLCLLFINHPVRLLYSEVERAMNNDMTSYPLPSILPFFFLFSSGFPGLTLIRPFLSIIDPASTVTKTNVVDLSHLQMYKAMDPWSRRRMKPKISSLVPRTEDSIFMQRILA